MSSSALGCHAKLVCPGCGVMVRAKDSFLWLERSGAEARAWHFDCRIAAYRDLSQDPEYDEWRAGQ